MPFSHVVSSLAESATLAIAKKVRQLKAEGRDVIGLTLGEPDMDTPTHIVEAAKKALDAGFTHYAPVSGYPELRQAICTKLKRDNDLDYTPDQIVVSTGAKQSLYNVVLALLNPGDHAVLPAPFWVSYEAMLHLAQAEVTKVITDIEADYKMSPQQLENAIQPNTKLVFLCTPSNPTGSMYSGEELAELVAVLERYPDIYVISDEIYEYITYGPKHVSLGTFAGIKDRVITVNGFSKGFAMTGWRLGYIAAPKEVAAICEKLQGQCTSGPNSFAMMGAIAGLVGDLSPTYEMRDIFRQRRDVLYDSLREIEGLEVNLPDGAFYFYPDFKAFLGRKTPAGDTINDINELCLYLVDQEGLALVPGSAFGTESHARLSYAYSQKELEEAVVRLKRGVEQLS